MAIDNKEAYSRPYILSLIERYIEYRYCYSTHPHKLDSDGSSPELSTTILIRKDGITDINITIEL